jgi:hypothetical protein
VVVVTDTNPLVISGIRKEGSPGLGKPVSPPGLRGMMRNIPYEPELVQKVCPLEPRS